MGKISPEIETGSVVRVTLDPTVGQEKKKERFCLVIEKGSSLLDLIIILPITNDTGKRSSRFYVPIIELQEAGLSKPSVIDCYQIRTISLERLIKGKSATYTMGKVDEKTLFEVRQRLAWILDIGVEHTSPPY